VYPDFFTTNSRVTTGHALSASFSASTSDCATLDNSPYWRAQRWTRFLVRLTRGSLRTLRQRISARPGATQRAADRDDTARHSEGRLA
jgi:hypothetical protein